MSAICLSNRAWTAVQAHGSTPSSPNSERSSWQSTGTTDFAAACACVCWAGEQTRPATAQGHLDPVNCEPFHHKLKGGCGEPPVLPRAEATRRTATKPDINLPASPRAPGPLAAAPANPLTPFPARTPTTHALPPLPPSPRHAHTHPAPRPVPLCVVLCAGGWNFPPFLQPTRKYGNLSLKSSQGESREGGAERGGRCTKRRGLNGARHSVQYIIASFVPLPFARSAVNEIS